MTKAEDAPFADQDYVFEARSLNAVLLGAVVAASRELIDDGIDLEGALSRNTAESLAVKADLLGISGDGTGTDPTGILNQAEIADTAAVGAITWGGVAAAVLACRQRNHEPTGGLMSEANAAALLESTDTQERWLGPPPTMENIAIVGSNQVDDTVAMVGDWSQMAVGVRQGLFMETTMTGGDTFSNHTMKIKTTTRIDHNVNHPEGFQKLSGITIV